MNELYIKKLDTNNVVHFVVLKSLIISISKDNVKDRLTITYKFHPEDDGSTVFTILISQIVEEINHYDTGRIEIIFIP